MRPKDADRIANIVDPDHDQTAPSVAFDPSVAVWSGSTRFSQTCLAITYSRCDIFQKHVSHISPHYESP